jgi:hypothetical protein
MRIVHTDSGTTVLNHMGVDYHRGPDGSFDVPPEVGEQLVGFPHWSRDYEAAGPDAERAAMAARIAELEALLAAGRDEPEQQNSAGTEEPAKLTAAQKKAAAKAQAEATPQA